MPARLVSLENGKSYALEKPIMLLGRHEDCDIQIESRKISRRHCIIAEVEDHIIVRDLGSTNGILVNKEKREESRLDHGDELTVGNMHFRVELKGGDRKAADDKTAHEKERPSARAKEQMELDTSGESPIPFLEAKSGEY